MIGVSIITITMNKPEFVAALAKELNISKTESDKIYDTFISILEKNSKTLDGVSLRGFGSFFVRHRDAREGVNPSTKEKIKIPAKKTIGFRPGKNLKNF